MYLLADIMTRLPQLFSERDDVFLPPDSTFEPTRRPGTVDNVNTIPGHDEFYMDIRLIPDHDPCAVVERVREIAAEHQERSGATIIVSIAKREISGMRSSQDTKGFRALSKAVEYIIGNVPTAVGIGGGTCGNLFRMKGLNAYVWQCGGGTLHAPNEHVVVKNMITDAKVFATLYYNLCVKG